MTKVIEIPEEYRPDIDDLPGDLARIATIIEELRPGHGVELTLFLAQAFRGQNMYFRNVDYLVRQVRDDAIRKEYDQGTRVRDLALKWRLCQRRVEKILSAIEKPGAGRQLSLF